MGDAERQLLTTVLQNQRILVDKENEHAEALRLAGLVKIELLKNKYLISPSCMCIDKVLRKYVLPLFKDDRNAITAAEVLPTTSTVNLHAAPIIYEVENTLRNMIGYELLTNNIYSEWQDILPVKLRDTLQDRWRQEQGRTVLTATKAPTLAYIDIGELKELLLVYYEKYFSRYFPKKEELQIWLEDLNAIRIAVAHNRAIPPETVDRLEHIRDDIMTRIGTAS